MGAPRSDGLQPNTPVLVGAGIVARRDVDPLSAAEPIVLMIEAARAAGRDACAPELLQQIDRILVPVGRWKYRNPGGMVGDAVGSPEALTVSALPGVSQQTLISSAANAIADGEITTALVVGGEAGHRLLRARIDGVEVRDQTNTHHADLLMKPDDPMVPAHERQRGLGPMPVGYYAVIDSAWRHNHGRSVTSHRDITADRYQAFSRIAATNSHGWDDEVTDRASIRDSSMLAFPYTRHHVSNWSVDQASALLLTTVTEADRLGVPADRRVFPHAFSEANHMVDVSARDDLGRCVGAEVAARAVLAAAGCGPDDIDHAELYTCFPVAVETYAEALGLTDRVPWTFTGGMPFAGGPYNNFVLHATAQLVERLRSAPGTRGLVTTVSGLLTKQGFAIWGTDANPGGYRFVDVTAETAAATNVRDIDADYDGPATVAGYTVMHDRSGPECGVVVVDLPDGKRSVATTSDELLMELMQTEEFCGRRVSVSAATFRLPQRTR